MRAANDDRESRRLTISDEDLTAYVAGTLPAARRTEVEGFLACNPDLAARVMTELHRSGRSGAGTAARRRRPWGLAAALGLIACAASALAGWQIAAQISTLSGWREADGDPAPRYVEEAVESRQAAQARAIMVSQADTPQMDSAEIERTLKLRAPRLPPGWRLIDAQVYPSDDGPALNVVVETPDGRRLNLFAVSADTPVNDRPTLARRGREAAAYWEEGRSAFVLLGGAPEDQLLQEARALAQAS